MNAALQSYCDTLIKDFNKIPDSRKALLESITQYIHDKIKANETVRLIYICTHNSRRSHFGQIWANIAAHYYTISGIETYSGGTEATAFHKNAIDALKRIGFNITADSQQENTIYHIFYDEAQTPINCFSKTYYHPINPQHGFAAILTCSDAEENCPYIPGVEFRVGTTYEDPKAYDDTSIQDEKYDERSRQIALETFYIFSNL